MTKLRASFTLAALLGGLLLCGLPSAARADQIVLLQLEGTADDLRNADVTQALSDTLRSMGHTVVTGDAVQRAGIPGSPRTSDEFVAIAQANGAAWVLTAEVHPLTAQYRLLLRAGYAPIRRVEELDVLVVVDEQAARLRDVLGSLVRPAGLGEDALRLTGGEDAAAAEERERLLREQREREAAEQAARDEAERQRQAEEEARARAEFDRREAERAQAERDRLAAAFDARERYAASPETPWLAQLGLSAAGLVVYDDSNRPPTSTGGGAFAALEFRVGYGLASVRGLELRGGMDLVLGQVNAVDLVVGAAYLTSPFSFPLHLGGAVELGAFLNTSGAREPGFLIRGGAVAAYRLAPRLYVEADLPTLTVISAAGGVVALGASARIGYRF
jgi:hypothetical protein